MKKLPWIIAVIFFILNIGLVYGFILKNETVSLEDGRKGIPLNVEQKVFILEEMRNFLESVRQVNEGILKNDKTLIMKAAELSGESVIEHAPQGIMKRLPMDFKALSFSTHAIFDEIGKSAKTNFEPAQTHEQMAKLLSNCVACHKQFKLMANE